MVLFIGNIAWLIVLQGRQNALKKADQSHCQYRNWAWIAIESSYKAGPIN